MELSITVTPSPPGRLFDRKTGVDNKTASVGEAVGNWGLPITGRNGQ